MYLYDNNKYIKDKIIIRVKVIRVNAIIKEIYIIIKGL
jgi:hypothetical protein